MPEKIGADPVISLLAPGGYSDYIPMEVMPLKRVSGWRDTVFVPIGIYCRLYVTSWLLCY